MQWLLHPRKKPDPREVAAKALGVNSQREIRDACSANVYCGSEMYQAPRETQR